MRRALTILAFASLILGSLAWGASVVQQPHQTVGCDNAADALWHLERSRNGVSLTCDRSLSGELSAASGSGQQ